MFRVLRNRFEWFVYKQRHGKWSLIGRVHITELRGSSYPEMAYKIMLDCKQPITPEDYLENSNGQRVYKDAAEFKGAFAEEFI